MAPVVVGIAGVLVGAFLNVCADQIPVERGVPRPPYCPHCDQPRSPAAWISILAYVARRSDCTHCLAPASLRHPLLELASGILFACLWLRLGPSGAFLLYAVYASIFFLLAVIDFEHHALPKSVIIPGCGIALAGSLLLPEFVPWYYAVSGAALGFAILLAIYVGGLLYARLSASRNPTEAGDWAFGFGDVMLGVLIGLILGAPRVIWAIGIGVLLGGIYALLYLTAQWKSRSRNARFKTIPYGPFLIMGALAVLFVAPNLRL